MEGLTAQFSVNAGAKNLADFLAPQNLPPQTFLNLSPIRLATILYLF